MGSLLTDYIIGDWIMWFDMDTDNNYCSALPHKDLVLSMRMHDTRLSVKEKISITGLDCWPGQLVQIQLHDSVFGRFQSTVRLYDNKYY